MRMGSSASISRSDSAARCGRYCGQSRQTDSATRKASGFVNAVMRRATRETAPMPARESNEKSYLAVVYSHPRWMVERFVDWFGVENAEQADDSEQRRGAPTSSG